MPLSCPPPEAIERIDDLLPIDWLQEFASRQWPEQDIPFSSLTGALPTKPAKVGSLYWPSGAARFAVGHYLVNLPTLTAIRAALSPAGTGALLINDGQRSVSPTMFMLPARPIERDGSSLSGWYMLSLVDDRFRWWFTAGKLVVDGVTTTWANLYAQIATILGITITADPVPAAYLMPSAQLTVDYPSTPLLLDAVAFSCGQRIARRLDGTVAALNPTTAQGVYASNLTLAYRLEGDAFDLPPQAKTDISRVLPSSVTVVFPGQGGPTWIEQVTLSSLALPEMGTAAGFSGTKTLYTELIATYNIAPTPTNEATLRALAIQAAKDWYRWMVEGIDATYSGAVAWVMEGICSLAEFVTTDERISTRIERGPYLDHNDRLLIGGLGAVRQCSPITGVAVAVTFIPPQLGGFPGIGKGIIQTIVGNALVTLPPGTIVTFFNAYTTGSIQPGASFDFVTDQSTCDLLAIPPGPCLPAVLYWEKVCPIFAGSVSGSGSGIHTSGTAIGSGSGSTGTGTLIGIRAERHWFNTVTCAETIQCVDNPTDCCPPLCCNYSGPICLTLANVQGCPCLDGLRLTFNQTSINTWTLSLTLAGPFPCCEIIDTSCCAGVYTPNNPWPASVTCTIFDVNCSSCIDGTTVNLNLGSASYNSMCPPTVYLFNGNINLTCFEGGGGTHEYLLTLTLECPGNCYTGGQLVGWVMRYELSGVNTGCSEIADTGPPAYQPPDIAQCSPLLVQWDSLEVSPAQGDITCTDNGTGGGGPCVPGPFALKFVFEGNSSGSGSGSSSGPAQCSYYVEGAIQCNNNTWLLNLTVIGVQNNASICAMEIVNAVATMVNCTPLNIAWNNVNWIPLNSSLPACCNGLGGGGSITATGTSGVCPGSSGSGSTGSGSRTSGSGSIGSGSGSGGPIVTACCPNGMPTVLHATISLPGGGFSNMCMLPIGVILTWAPFAGAWVGQTTACGGCTVIVILQCEPGSTDCSGFQATVLIEDHQGLSTLCSLHWTFSANTMASCTCGPPFSVVWGNAEADVVFPASGNWLAGENICCYCGAGASPTDKIITLSITS